MKFFKAPKIIGVFTVRIVYKSGHTHDFDVRSFSVNNGRYEWKAHSKINKPILLGGEEIAAVYQVGFRKTLTFA